jgi:hypothetical protein
MGEPRDRGFQGRLSYPKRPETPAFEGPRQPNPRVRVRLERSILPSERARVLQDAPSFWGAVTSLGRGAIDSSPALALALFVNIGILPYSAFSAAWLLNQLTG